MGDRPSAVRPWTGRRVVLVHDWLTGMRGGEKVLESLCRILPGAELLTLFHVPGSVSKLIEARRIRTSILNWIPGAGRRYRQLLPLFPAVIEWFNLDDVDLVVSTSHCAAKAVVPAGRARHVCYCHSPMRYAWDQFDAYFGPARVGRWRHAMLRPTMAALARWDRGTAPRVDCFVANSRFVATRIARYYNRLASVVYPPVDTAFYTPGTTPPEPYFLVVSALVPYKRIELALAAADRARARLVVIGSGPEDARLRAQAGPTVEFRGALHDADLRDAYRHATAVVMPAEEDFGIVPVEAMACGRPVIALGRGGARETVEPGQTGLLVDDASTDAFADAMADAARRQWDTNAIRAHAERFGVDRFEADMRSVLANALTEAAC